jgi:tRNA A-37 threonylcarbamoyl transferase component Bud32
VSGGAPTNPRPGETIAERYRVIGEIGSGGMGAVFRVEHTMMAKEMAMKLLRPELSGINEVAERFEREAKSAARLDHHHIVRVTDFGRTDDGALFLVMELLEGQPLTELLKERGKLEPNEAIRLVDQILEALEHAHGHAVIHRDLKPDNVMVVEKDGQRVVKLLDFGLAKITETKLEEGRQLTTAGTVFGTPRYMSPEQASGEPTDQRADLYSVGVMLYELVSGKPPFAGASTVDVLRMHLTAPPPSLEVEGCDRSQLESLDAVIQKAMAKHPKDRFPDAASFREALLACLAETDPAVVERTHQKLAEARFASITLSVPKDKLRLGLPAAGAGLVVAGTIALIAAIASGPGSGDLEEALAAGDVARAQLVVDEMRTADPNDPRLPLFEGHLAHAKGETKESFDAYKRALSDPKLEIDDRFEQNILELVHDKPKAADSFVKLIAHQGGASTTGLLVQVFEEAPNPLIRRYAYEGVVRLDARGKLRDPVGALAADLEKQSNRHCKARKWYVEQLIQFEDQRVLEALQAEQKRRGNFFQEIGGGVNKCMGGLLEAEIGKRRS